MVAMQVTTGTVVNGKVVVEGTTLPEGSMVAILSHGADEGFRLSSAQEDELLASIAEIERGDFAGLEELLAKLAPAR